MNTRITSFEPIVDQQSEILILGSMPGVKSLQMQEYYAHPQNAFWKILYTLYNVEFSVLYKDKTLFLKENKIALWDVIESCERKGSLDTTIKSEVNNDILELLKKYSSIKVIFCNGQKSYKNLIKQFGKELQIPVFVLSSTSPLHTISFEDKLMDWQKILSF